MTRSLLNPKQFQKSWSLVLQTASNSVNTNEVASIVQGGALNRGLFFADPPPSLLGAVSGKISEIR